MLVATTVSKEKIELSEVPDPESRPGHAIVEVDSVTLCGTDVHIWQDHYPAADFPLVQGHEIAGTVRSVEYGGEWRVGDRVAVNPMIYCGGCYACSIGRYNACKDMLVLGCHTDGGFAELLSVPVDKLHRVPDAVPLEIAGLAEPASIAAQAVNRSRAAAGEKVLVLGCGPIGLFAALKLNAMGVEVLAVDRLQSRVDTARQFGASRVHVVSGSYPDAAQQAELDEWTGGQGPAVVIEATGVTASLEGALDLVANAGRVVSVGISTNVAQLSMKVLPYKELDLLGSRNSLHLIPEGLGLLERFPAAASSLLTHRFLISDLDEAFRLAASGTEGVGKIAIDVNAGA